MPFFLCDPLAGCLFGIRKGITVGMYHDGRIRPPGHPVDKKIVIARPDVVMRNKAIVPVEDLFQVREIPAHPHIGNACQGIRQVLDGNMDRIEPDEPVKQSRAPRIGSITQHHLYFRGEGRLHVTDPVPGSRFAVGIGEQYLVISGRFDPDRKRELLS